VTLFRNENVHSSGAVGFALTGGRPPKSTVEFPGVQSITPPLTVNRLAMKIDIRLRRTDI
jgi:small ligand-binding sensory domain FIST